jgi:deoxycytidylate deaminase
VDPPDTLSKYDCVIHAEENAILNCHVRPQGWSLYTTLHPCGKCAARIAQAGVSRVFYNEEPDNPNLHFWKAKEIFTRCNIPLTRI